MTLSRLISRAALVAIVATGLLAGRTALAGGIHFYNVAGGAFNSSQNPTLSGGEFNGRSVNSLTFEEVLDVRDTGGSELVLRGSSGVVSFYNVGSGAFNSGQNPTLSGGPFSGQTVSSLARSSIIGVRDSGGSELMLFGPAGVSFYNVSGTGGFSSSQNPTLSGGDFGGQTVSSLPLGSILGVRDSGGTDLMLRGPSGVNFYNVSTGAFTSLQNPTLSGGDFAGETINSLPFNYIIGMRDSGGSELVVLATVPEPQSIALLGLGMVAVGGFACRRRKV